MYRMCLTILTVWVDTDFAGVLIRAYGERLAARTPVGRLGVPDDVASFASFLVSDAAAWISGDTFVLDGGSGVMGGE